MCPSFKPVELHKRNQEKKKKKHDQQDFINKKG